MPDSLVQHLVQQELEGESKRGTTWIWLTDFTCQYQFLFFAYSFHFRLFNPSLTFVVISMFSIFLSNSHPNLVVCFCNVCSVFYSRCLYNGNETEASYQMLERQSVNFTVPRRLSAIMQCCQDPCEHPFWSFYSRKHVCRSRFFVLIICRLKVVFVCLA